MGGGEDFRLLFIKSTGKARSGKCEGAFTACKAAAYDNKIGRRHIVWILRDTGEGIAVSFRMKSSCRRRKIPQVDVLEQLSEVFGMEWMSSPVLRRLLSRPLYPAGSMGPKEKRAVLSAMPDENMVPALETGTFPVHERTLLE